MYQAKQLLLQMLDEEIFEALAFCNFFLNKTHSETIIIISYSPYFNKIFKHLFIFIKK